MNEAEGINVDEQPQAPGPRQYTYTAELEKRGISRDSPAYVYAVDEALMWLRMHRSFFGFIVDEMTRSSSLTARTAQVEIKHASIVMTMNPDFMALLPMRHRAGVIMHECLHVMNLHIPRMRGLWPMLTERQRKLMPIIIDLPVNSLIADPRDLPTWCVRPEQFRVPDDKKDKSQWSQFPARKHMEFYADLFKSMSPEQADQCVKDACGEQKPGEGGHGQAPRADGDQELGSGQGIDDHEPWLTGDCDEADNEMLTEIIKNHVRSAVAKAESRGVGQGDLAELLSELLKERAVNFRGLFAGMIGRFTTVARKPTMMRLSRRYGQPPGRTLTRKLDIRFYQDTSGSMASEEVLIGLSEARHAEDTGQARVMVQQFDWGLQGQAVSVTQMGVVNVAVKGRGGTSLRDVIADIDKSPPDLVIIATDGGLEHDMKPAGNVPVIWLLTHDGHAPPWGLVLRLPSLAEIKAGQKAKGKAA